MDYPSLFVSAFHNGCINCVIHNNPNFHTRQWQPNSSCQTQRKPMNTERREHTLSKQNGMIFGLYRSGTHILAIISEKAIKSIQWEIFNTRVIFSKTALASICRPKLANGLLSLYNTKLKAIRLSHHKPAYTDSNGDFWAMPDAAVFTNFK